MFVVTGPPGSGKSALLGMLLATSDDTITDALAATNYGRVPDDLRPVGIRFDAIAHLSGRTIAETTHALAQALGLGPDTFFDGLATLGRRRILVDALDEARDPYTIAAFLR